MRISDWSSDVCSSDLRIGHGRVTVDLPSCQESFESYDSYVSYLVRKTTGIYANATSSARRHPFDCYTTLSTGYDSTAVASLVGKHCGIARCVMASPEGVDSHRREEARPIAEGNGMGALFIKRQDARSVGQEWV